MAVSMDDTMAASMVPPTESSPAATSALTTAATKDFQMVDGTDTMTAETMES